MFGEASSLFRGTCISATLYAILFLSHIVAAAQDWDFMFRCIAASITLLTFSVGPSIQVLGKIQQHQEKMKANAKGNFTNPSLFLENGGHITKQQRERFKYIHNHKASFQL